MKRKDYYLILGISRADSPSEVRRAYRDLAHRHHPDRVGPEGTPFFQEINEAYEVLSDPRARAAYDREHASTTVPVQVVDEPTTAGPFHRSRAPGARFGPRPEPLIREEMSLFDDFAVVRPSVEALFDRFLRHATGRGLPKSGRVEPVTVELCLTPNEAARGGAVSLGIPVWRPCPRCRGTGGTGGMLCFRCDGTGMSVSERTIRIALPPHLRDHDRFWLPAQHHGIHNLALNLLIRVDRG